MTRLLYVSDSAGEHDRRFVGAWRKAGLDVLAPTVPNGETAYGSLAREIHVFAPDVVQVGPLTGRSSQLIPDVWTGPLIATSWGFDLLLDAEESPAARGIAARTLGRADLVFVDSDATRDSSMAYGVEPDHIVTFPWGVGGEWLNLPTHRPLPLHPVFLSVRRHEPLYRVADIVEAFLAIAPSNPEARLVVAGEGSLTPQLAERARKSDSRRQISFVGEQPAAKLRQLMRDADIYVSATRVDGTSVSLLEAMAAGMPVVVSDIAGNAAWVGEDTGLTFPIGDVAALAKIMDRFCDAPRGFVTESRDRALRATQLVHERADWEDTTKRFEGFARRAIDNHTRR